jgi:hypothetical protein
MGGAFSRPILDQFLRQNDMTEAMFLSSCGTTCSACS